MDAMKETTSQNKKNLRIGIDIDDVITEFRKGFLEYYKKTKDFSFNFWEAYGSYSIKQFFPEDYELEKEIEKFHFLPEFEELDLIEGSDNVIKKINKDHEVVFITSRPPKHKDATQRFMKKYFPEDLKIIHSEEMDKKVKENKNPLTKGEICERESVDIMIEDNFLYAKDCAERGIFVFLLEKPWNREFISENYPNMERVKNWEDILNKINKIYLRQN